MVVSNEDLLLELLLEIFNERSHIKFDQIVTSFFNLNFEMQKIFEIVLLVNSKIGNLGVESNPIFVMKMVVCLWFSYLIRLFIVVDIKSAKIAPVS